MAFFARAGDALTTGFGVAAITLRTGAARVEELGFVVGFGGDLGAILATGAGVFLTANFLATVVGIKNLIFQFKSATASTAIAVILRGVQRRRAHFQILI